MKAKKCVLFILLLFLINSQPSFTQNQISLNIIGSGGERSSNTDFVLNSSTGEVFTGKSLNAFYHQYSGFWYIYSNSITTSIQSDEDITPANFKLEQNYPNPFNPSTIIKFAIAEQSKVVIQIYDITGSKVITLVNEEMDAGWYQREFNAAGLSSGIYLVRLQADNFVNTKKMLMLK
jgi:GH43 family beta-xylosidase